MQAFIIYLFVYLGNIPVTSNVTDINSSEVIENLTENELDHIDEPVADEYESLDENSQSTSKEYVKTPSTSNVKTHNKKKRPSVLLEDVNKAAFDFFSKKNKTEVEDDTDLCFFKSLLPDMKLMNPDQKRRYKAQMINLAGCILSEPTIYNEHQTHSFIPREYADYRQSLGKQPHSNSLAQTSSNDSSLNIQLAKHQHQNTNLNSLASFKVLNKPNTVSNQQRTHVTSKGYYNTDVRPNSASSNISSSSGTSIINISSNQCQQDNTNLGLVVPPSVQHQTQPSVQQDVKFTYPYYN